MSNNIIELERSINVELMLKSMSIEFVHDREDLRFCCPFHDGDNPTSGVFFKNTNAFICYASDCTNGKIIPLVIFVQKIHSLTFKQATKWMEQKTKMSYFETGFKNTEEETVKYQIPKKPEYEENKAIRTFFLQNSVPYILYMRKRGISMKTARHFEIEYSDTKYYGQRIIFPIKDEYGTIVAYSGRCIDDSIIGTVNKDNFIIPKYKIIPKGFKKKQHVYNLNQAQKKKYVIIVEGNHSVWFLFGLGIYAVSIVGSKMSDSQAYLILKYFRNKDIFLCFERDVAGTKCQISTNIFLRRYAKNVYTIRLPYEFDPGEITSKRKFLKFMNKAKGTNN